MTDEGRPAVVRFHLSRAKPRELSCLGEVGKFLPLPETVDPSMEGGANGWPESSWTISATQCLDGQRGAISINDRPCSFTLARVGEN